MAWAALSALLIAIVSGILNVLHSKYLLQYSLVGTRLSALYWIWSLAQSVIFCRLMAHFLGRLYQLRPIPKSVYGFGVVSGILLQGVWLTL